MIIAFLPPRQPRERDSVRKSDENGVNGCGAQNAIQTLIVPEKEAGTDPIFPHRPAHLAQRSGAPSQRKQIFLHCCGQYRSQTPPARSIVAMTSMRTLA